MRRTIVAFAATTLLGALLATPAGASSDASSGPGAAVQGSHGGLVPVTKASGKRIAGQYVVTLDRDAAAGAVSAGLGIRTLHTYRAALHGFAARLTPGQLRAVRSNPHVARVEEDAVVHADAAQTNPPWNLDRIDERLRDLQNTYSWEHDGTGVNAYIIDTGIDTSHPEFSGRARVAHDTLGGDGQDCNGHGTHVAGVVGSETYGVAKGVTLHAVRVLNCTGSGSISGVVAGIDWVAAHHQKPAVANISLGGSFNLAMNQAVTNMTLEGVFTSVSAGASNSDACGFSPASAENVTVVAAVDGSDTSASFNNHGGCVDVFAPGMSITSTWLSGGANTISGTSMGTAHATGAGAIYREVHPNSTSAEVNDWVIETSTKNVVKNVPPGTPNRLLYKPPAL